MTIPTAGLNDLAAYIGQVNRDHGFRDHIDAVYATGDDDTIRDMHGNQLMLIVGEVVEAHEDIRSGLPVTGMTIADSGKPEGVASEIADILIRTLDFANGHGIDIEAAVANKVAYNQTRRHKHGRKF